jgi:aldehyde dehydrogenase (NAD+)
VFERKEHFIGGNWHRADGGDLLEVISPSTEEVVGRVPVAGPAEIDSAVEAARQALAGGPWSRMSLAERAGYLRQFAAELHARREESVEL